MDMDDARIWAECWKVDEVIEAIDYHKAGITRERWIVIEGTLMKLAPNAYRGVGVMMIDIWEQLTPGMREEIYRAYLADYWPKDLK